MAQQDRKISDDLLAFLRNRDLFSRGCSFKGKCVIFFINLDDDVKEEVIFIKGMRGYENIFIIDKDDNGSWQKVGKLAPSQYGKWYKSRKELEQFVKNENVKAVSNQYKSLKVGEKVLYFSESN